MWAFEKNYVLPEEIDQGPVPARWLLPVWLFLTVFLCSFSAFNAYFYCGFGLTQALLLVPFAFVFARLAAIDLCYLLLLNIYTVPLFISGLAFNIFITGGSVAGVGLQESLLGAFLAALVGVLLNLFMSLFDRQKGEFGFGDVKMLAVMGVWVGLEGLAFALAIAFVSNLVIAFLIPRNQPLPFGFGLVIGTWVLVAFKEPFLDGLFYAFG